MTKIIHIGLGKCGSTFLQQKVLKKIAEKLKINYIKIYNNNFFKIDKSKIQFHAFENLKNLEKNLPDQFIMSHDALFSYDWQFSNINKSFENIRDNFSKDTVILIVIRDPYDYLNSVYSQMIQAMIEISKPENFFYYEEIENKKFNKKFNLYNFDYLKLISLYKSYFKKVVVVKYEDLQKLDFIKKIYNLDNDFINELKNNTSTVVAKSISKYGINFILFLNKFFNVIKFQRFIRRNINPSNNIILKVKNKILAQFILRSFFTEKFYKIIPYKKYKIKKKHLPINIDDEILKYKNMKFD